jgi:hypothetical protein
MELSGRQWSTPAGGALAFTLCPLVVHTPRQHPVHSLRWQLIKENIVVLTSGKVVSSCGTSLGSYLPDSQVLATTSPPPSPPFTPHHPDPNPSAALVIGLTNERATSSQACPRCCVPVACLR